MNPRHRRRKVLVRVDELDASSTHPAKLRVHVTLYGLSAALVEELAELSERSRSQVVRTLVAEAVARRTVYDEVE